LRVCKNALFCACPFKCKWSAAEGGVSRACVLAAALLHADTKMTETVLPLILKQSQSKMERPKKK